MAKRISAELLVRRRAVELHRHYYGDRQIYPHWEDDPARVYSDERSVSPFRRMGNTFTFEGVSVWFAIDEVRYLDFITYTILYNMPTSKWSVWQQEKHSAHLLALQTAMAKREGKVHSSLHNKEQYDLKISLPLVSVLYAFEKVWKLEFDDFDIINFYLYKASTITDYYEAKKFDTKYRMTLGKTYSDSLVKLKEIDDILRQWDWPPVFIDKNA
jgi:hypothetical protein